MKRSIGAPMLVSIEFKVTAGCVVQVTVDEQLKKHL